MTIIEKLAEAIRRAGIYNRHDLAPPAVILWTDGERLWEKVISQAQESIPELLVLDSSASGGQCGPSTWIRYHLTRGALDDPWVIYLPGVSRHLFRGAAGFPESARHLYSLQFRGQFWTQSNGRDWTPYAFLSSADGGLGLEVARDDATRGALSAQLSRVLSTPLSSLAGHKLEASDFHGLAAGDPVRLLLRWIGDQAEVKKSLGDSGWQSFGAICRERYGLDPDRDGVITAVEKLVAGGSSWDAVWERYCEAPTFFGRVREALDLAKPKDLFDTDNARLPATNRQAEELLRKELTRLGDLPGAGALEALEKLVTEHEARASSVWARLGEAPLARAVRALGVMAATIRQGTPGMEWQALAVAYGGGLWQCDASAWKALAAVRDPADLVAVGAALRGVYRPWLEELSDRVQKIGAAYPNAAPAFAPEYTPAPGTMLLFVDGLRYDLGAELRTLLENQGLEAEIDALWAALPTVTGTTKPAWSPLAGELTGEEISEAFEPQGREGKRTLKTAEFRKLLTTAGWPFVPSTERGEPAGSGWTETGSFDEYGHDQGVKLAWRIEEELSAVSGRIRELLAAGWSRVVVVTDHGFLLMPGGLPKVDLPRHLTVSKWGRCALAEAGAQHGHPEVPWYWGGQHSVVLAPGISAFAAGQEYAHGGLSIQEALVPRLTVTAVAGAASGRDVRISSVKWAGLRLRVRLEGASEALRLDLRSKPADAGTSVLSEDQRAKGPDMEGQASLRVDHEDLIGSAAILVVLLEGQVVCKQPVTIGED